MISPEDRVERMPWLGKAPRDGATARREVGMPNSDRGEGEPCREAEKVCDRGSTTGTLGARPPLWRDPERVGVVP